jgi:hypothetical protein
MIALFALLAACGPLSTGGDDYNPEAFREVIEAAQEDGLTAYWLGREVAIPRSTFDSIGSDRLELLERPLNRVFLHYSPLDRSESGHIDITTFTLDEWERDSERYINPLGVGVERQSASVNGRDAAVLISSAFPGSRNTILVVLTFEEVVVVASTSTYRGARNEETNPLMDVALFLQTLEALRPYPE